MGVRSRWLPAAALAFAGLAGHAHAGPKVELSIPSSAEAGTTEALPILVHGTAAEVTLTANVGTLSALAPTDDPAIRRAQWTPPKGKAPRVVVIAAVDGAGDVLDWGGFPLVGRARVTTRSKPGAEVRLVVGPRELGPVPADRNGLAAFTVPIHPGETTAISRAKDLTGRTEETVLALDPPPFQPLLLLCPAEGPRVRVLVASTGGGAHEGAALSIGTDAGHLADPIAVAPGIYDLVLDPGTSAATHANIRVALAGSAATPATCRKRLPGELPTSLELQVAPAELVAGGPPVSVSVLLRYPGARPPEPVAVSLVADRGALDAPVRGEDGTWRAVWRIEPDLEGRTRARVTARADGATPLEQEAVVPLRPGPVQRIVLQADRERVRADGRSTVEVQVDAHDAWGNRLASKEYVTLDGGEGEIGPLAASTSGRAVATWRAPRRTTGGDAVIAGRTETGVESALRLRLLPGRGRFSVAAHLGWISNLGRVSAPSSSLSLGWRVPRLLDERIGVGMEAGWFRSRSLPRTENGETLRVEVQGAPFLLRATGDLSRGRIGTYAGLAAGVILAEVETRSPATGERRGGGVRPAGGVLAGADLPVGWRGRAGIELAWRHAPVAWAGLRGNVAGLSATALWRVEF